MTLQVQTGRGRHERTEGVGERSLRLRSGKSETVSMELDRRGRGLLKADRTLRVTVTVSQGKRVVLKRRLRLRYVRPARRHRS